MRGIKNPMRVLLLASLLLTGVWCKTQNAVFMYSRLGAEILLPCTNLGSSNCSLVSWTFYKGRAIGYTQVVTKGQMVESADISSTMSITSNCSLRLDNLRVDDSGHYTCQRNEYVTTTVYLSLLAVTTNSHIPDLRPRGSLILSCILFTYYDAGSCKPYSSMFSLSWTTEDGRELPKDSRYELIVATRCNITLVTKLRSEDNGRRWRCQVNTTENSRTVFQDFTSAFLFQNPSPARNQSPPSALDCQVQLPISRIVLCVALPVMVIIVGLFTWRVDNNRAKMSAVGIEL